MSKPPWKDILRDYLDEPRPIKLVADQCDCSKADLKEFGFCLCGSAALAPVSAKKTAPKITIEFDYSGSMDHDLFREFLELIGELPKKP